MKAVLIVNPAARLVGNVVSVESIVGCLQGAGLDVTLRLTDKAGDASAFAREAVQSGARRVVVAGGDGTINEAIQSLAGTETELAIVPLGTGNIIARYAGLGGGNYPVCCDVAAAGEVRQIDLGLMGERYFVATAGAGIDAQIVLNLDPWWKQQIGRIAFMTEFLRTLLMQEPHVFRIKLEAPTLPARTIEGPMWGVLICNTDEYSWRIRPAPDVRVDDGLLDVVLIHRQGFLDFMDLAARMFFSGETAAGHPTATVVRVGAMEIEAEPSVPWQVEGESKGFTPVSVKVVPRSLRLVVAR